MRAPHPPPERRGVVGVRLAGVLLAGYGALVLLRLLAHENPWVGLGLVVTGGALVLAARPDPVPRQDARSPKNGPGRAARVATGMLGATAAGGVLAYNGLRGSTITVPEGAILAYGVLLLAATPHLDRRLGSGRVEDAVAWSLPLLAAPLAVYALDAALNAGAGGSPLDAFIVHGLVAPMAAGLGVLGFAVDASGQTIALGTPRGTLFLSVGVVCAGFQPGILFLGVFGLHAWRARTPPARLAALLGVGLVGVYAANLLRLIVLGLVGYRWGGAALQATHAHAGWILFVGWMILYWWWVLRRFEGPSARPAPAAKRDG